MKVYYFGCWGGPGHHLWTVTGRTARDTKGLPWQEHELDAKLCPGYVGAYQTPDRIQVEGHAALHHLGGWTVLAFWDRSVDKRGGCNSSFIAESIFTADEMLELARRHFPAIMGRLTFEIRVVQAPEAA